MRLKYSVPVIIAMTLFSLICALMAWRLLTSPHLLPHRRLLLDEAGCVAAKHFGLTVTPLGAAHACELVAEAEIEFNWITVGATRINRAHVLGAQTVEGSL